MPLFSLNQLNHGSYIFLINEHARISFGNKNGTSKRPSWQPCCRRVFSLPVRVLSVLKAIRAATVPPIPAAYNGPPFHLGSSPNFSPRPPPGTKSKYRKGGKRRAREWPRRNFAGAAEKKEEGNEEKGGRRKGLLGLDSSPGEKGHGDPPRSTSAAAGWLGGTLVRYYVILVIHKRRKVNNVDSNTGCFFQEKVANLIIREKWLLLTPILTAFFSKKAVNSSAVQFKPPFSILFKSPNLVTLWWGTPSQLGRGGQTRKNGDFKGEDAKMRRTKSGEKRTFCLLLWQVHREKASKFRAVRPDTALCHFMKATKSRHIAATVGPGHAGRSYFLL